MRKVKVQTVKKPFFSSFAVSLERIVSRKKFGKTQHARACSTRTNATSGRVYNLLLIIIIFVLIPYQIIMHKCKFEMRHFAGIEFV